eukprot:TRINITY_DN3115_c0_g1_i1.p1 TRINITY_DN3115_c0_g1~~TRINITY_DN3115_c0_g1_i1.p1  ORF type:complete len:1274 (+),score=340.40 TRINITY_DN3115_c0_g1_i1:90-3824(+)
MQQHYVRDPRDTSRVHINLSKRALTAQTCTDVLELIVDELERNETIPTRFISFDLSANALGDSFFQDYLCAKLLSLSARGVALTILNLTNTSITDEALRLLAVSWIENIGGSSIGTIPLSFLHVQQNPGVSHNGVCRLLTVAKRRYHLWNSKRFLKVISSYGEFTTQMDVKSPAPAYQQVMAVGAMRSSEDLGRVTVNWANEGLTDDAATTKLCALMQYFSSSSVPSTEVCLNFSHNPVGESFIRELVKSLSELSSRRTQIVELDLSSCALNDQCLKLIAVEWLQGCSLDPSPLRRIAVNGNKGLTEGSLRKFWEVARAKYTQDYPEQMLEFSNDLQNQFLDPHQAPTASVEPQQAMIVPVQPRPAPCLASHEWVKEVHRTNGFILDLTRRDLTDDEGIAKLDCIPWKQVEWLTMKLSYNKFGIKFVRHLATLLQQEHEARSLMVITVKTIDLESCRLDDECLRVLCTTWLSCNPRSRVAPLQRFFIARNENVSRQAVNKFVEHLEPIYMMSYPKFWMDFYAPNFHRIPREQPMAVDPNQHVHLPQIPPPPQQVEYREKPALPVAVPLTTQQVPSGGPVVSAVPQPQPSEPPLKAAEAEAKHVSICSSTGRLAIDLTKDLLQATRVQEEILSHVSSGKAALLPCGGGRQVAAAALDMSGAPLQFATLGDLRTLLLNLRKATPVVLDSLQAQGCNLGSEGLNQLRSMVLEDQSSWCVAQKVNHSMSVIDLRYNRLTHPDIVSLVAFLKDTAQHPILLRAEWNSIEGDIDGAHLVPAGTETVPLDAAGAAVYVSTCAVSVARQISPPATEGAEAKLYLVPDLDTIKAMLTSAPLTWRRLVQDPGLVHLKDRVQFLIPVQSLVALDREKGLWTHGRAVVAFLNALLPQLVDLGLAVVTPVGDSCNLLRVTSRDPDNVALRSGEDISCDVDLSGQAARVLVLTGSVQLRDRCSSASVWATRLQTCCESLISSTAADDAKSLFKKMLPWAPKDRFVKAPGGLRNALFAMNALLFNPETPSNLRSEILALRSEVVLHIHQYSSASSKEGKDTPTTRKASTTAVPMPTWQRKEAPQDSDDPWADLDANKDCNHAAGGDDAPSHVGETVVDDEDSWAEMGPAAAGEAAELDRDDCYEAADVEAEDYASDDWLSGDDELTPACKPAPPPACEQAAAGDAPSPADGESAKGEEPDQQQAGEDEGAPRASPKNSAPPSTDEAAASLTSLADAQDAGDDGTNDAAQQPDTPASGSS